MAGMELQNTVKEAVTALCHHLDDACRMQADRWLQEFQRTIDAWQLVAPSFDAGRMMLDAHAAREIATAAAAGPQTELLHIRRRS